jgi:dTDP-4-amino-4,6-dideoxygalactose transaminase
MSRIVKWDNPDVTQADIDAAVESLHNHLGAKGPNVDKLEKAFADKLGVKHAIAVDNGTNAMVATSMVLKHLYGELTIGVPSFTFIASANAPQFVFNNIKFLDISKDDWNIDPEKIKGVDAIMAVDCAGLSADYDELKKLNIPIIADSAESAGAKYKGAYVGGQVLMHTFSLHRSKLITCGEGGMITTNDDLCNELLRSYINHGYDMSKESWNYKHKTLGLNFRMSDVHAAIALSQLNRLDDYVEHRRTIAKVYDNKLGKLEKQVFDSLKYHHNYFLYGVLVEDRNRIIRKLNELGIVVKAWASIAGQECYQRLDPEISKYVADRVLLLPINNRTTIEEAEYVSKTILSLL